MHSSRSLALSKYSLVAAILLLPVFGYWAATVRFGTAFVEAWLPGDDSARADYREFREHFGDDQFLIVSWPGCTVDDPRLERVASELRALAAEAPLLKVSQVQDSSQMLAVLTEGPAGVGPMEAMRRLKGFAIGEDGTCFVSLKVNDAPIEQRSLLIDSVRRIASQHAGVATDELILAGEPFQVYMIDKSSRETIEFYVVPSSILSLFFAWLCLRRIRLTLLVFALSGVGQLVGLALISFFVGEMSAVLVVLPTLIFMLTLSAAVHLTNYYVDVGGDANRFAGCEALQLGAKPCMLATLTTVFGFGSLAVSQLGPVWQFGMLSAGGLLIASTLLLSVFPAASQLGIWRHSPPDKNVHASHTTVWIESRLASITNRFATPITVAGIALLAFAAAGLTRLGTSTEFDDMFPEDSDSIQSLRFVQEHLGPINSMEFLVSFPSSSGLEDKVRDEANSLPSPDLLMQIGLVHQVQSALESSAHVHSAMSATTFFPELPEGTGTRNTIRRAVLRKMLEVNRDSIAAHGLLSRIDGQETWRISARIRQLRGDNYVMIRDQLLNLAERGLTDYASTHNCQAPTLELTGLRTVVEKAHYALLSDLGGSFVTAFILITPVMMIIVRGILSGLILMIPNVLPVAFVFGCMGWFGVRLDVASILTASVALGIAVDDTLHFLTWFLRHRRADKSQSESVRAAIDACARPMFHTTFICAGAMLPFFFSQFLPTSKFASLMILILSGAIIGDLVLLPAILQSPLGRLVGNQLNSGQQFNSTGRGKQ